MICIKAHISTIINKKEQDWYAHVFVAEVWTFEMSLNVCHNTILSFVFWIFSVWLWLGHFFLFPSIQCLFHCLCISLSWTGEFVKLQFWWITSSLLGLPYFSFMKCPVAFLNLSVCRGSSLVQVSQDESTIFHIHHLVEDSNHFAIFSLSLAPKYLSWRLPFNFTHRLKIYHYFK